MAKLLGARSAVAWAVAVAATCLLLFGATASVGAQAPQGATLTVTSGQAGVLRATGAPVSPAASGLSLGVGDQVGTIGNSSALVTFFEGTELELGRDTTIILREIRSSGNEVHVTIEDVLGTTSSRLNAFVNPNSSYQVQNPGGAVVAIGRGTRIYYDEFGKNEIVGLSDCNARPAGPPAVPPQPARPSECYLLVLGARYDGPGIFLIREGVVTTVANTDRPAEPPGLQQPTGPAGGSTGDTPGGEDSQTNEDTYGFVPASKLLAADLLRERLGGGLSPLGASGTLLAAGMIGWTLYGFRLRRRR